MFGKRFRLKTATIALKHGGQKPAITHLPKGAEVLVIDRVPVTAEEQPNRQVNVEHGGRPYSMFLADIRERGELLPPATGRRS